MRTDEGRGRVPGERLRAFEAPGLREVAYPDVLARRGPAIDFLPLDLPFDIETPRRLSRLEPECLERDLDLRDPSLVGNRRHSVPDAVPILAEPFGVVRHLPVSPGTGWIHLEKEAVPMIEEGIENDHDALGIQHTNVGVF